MSDRTVEIQVLNQPSPGRLLQMSLSQVRHTADLHGLPVGSGGLPWEPIHPPMPHVDRCDRIG